MAFQSRASTLSTVLATLLLGGCTHRPPTAPPVHVPPPGDLVFQSDFEGDTRVVPFENRGDDIVGATPGLPLGDWERLQTEGPIKNVWVNYTGGNPAQRFAKVIAEPARPSNQVLQFWLNEAWVADGGVYKARVQVEFHDIEGGFREFYQSVRVFLTQDFETLKNYPGKISWCTISEFWNNEWWIEGENHGFRVTLGIGKPAGPVDNLHFILDAERGGQKDVWVADNHHIPVPIGTWFTMEYYYKEGDAGNGRFWMAITPEGGLRNVVFDVYNVTQHPDDPSPDGVTGYNPLKLYTSRTLVDYVRSQGKTLQIYWDDLRLWRAHRAK